MNNCKQAALRGGISMLAALAAISSASASAQTTPQITVGKAPLSDTNCDFNNPQQPAPTTVPPCLVDGSRDVTLTGVTRTSLNSTTDRVTATYNVVFDGKLQLDGLPVATGPGAVFPFNNGPRDASLFFNNGNNNDAQVVDLTANYTAQFLSAVGATAPTPNQDIERAYFNGQISNVNNQVRSIAVNQEGSVQTSDGNEYDFTLKSVDPTVIIGGNSVAVLGNFRGDEDNGLIQFGRLTGTATLSGRTITPYPEGVGSVNTGLLSPFALGYAITAELTTQLDENGLITPTISVTDGINMNGSRLTNLGDGIDAGDAVNKAQLDAALARIAASSSIVTNNNGGAAPQAQGNGAVSAGSGTTANGEGAVAIGLENIATGNGAVAIGDPNVATGQGAVAIGADNTATGDGAVAVGNLSVANGAGNVALGNGAQAIAANTVALGGGSVANQANTVSVGAVGTERRIVNVAAGTATTDATNRGQLDAEATTRAAADVQLAGAINTESMTRTQQMLQVNQRIATEESARAALGASLANETNARLAADMSLNTRINGIGSRLDQIDSRLNGMENRVSSGTAVATAMGGAAFLPDMKFNLTANVATYDGAHAGALQLGILVSPNVAVNAGVASGFNKNGKTAARAGVTFGW